MSTATNNSTTATGQPINAEVSEDDIRKFATQVQIKPQRWQDRPVTDRLAAREGAGADDYGLEVAGNLMAPAACEGDIVIASPSAKVEDGELVVLWPRRGTPSIFRLKFGAGGVSLVPVAPENTVDPFFVVERGDGLHSAIAGCQLAAIHRVTEVIRRDDVQSRRR